MTRDNYKRMVTNVHIFSNKLVLLLVCLLANVYDYLNLDNFKFIMFKTVNIAYLERLPKGNHRMVIIPNPKK